MSKIIRNVLICFLMLYMSVTDSTFAADSDLPPFPPRESPFGIAGVRYPFWTWDKAEARTRSNLMRAAGATWARGLIVAWGKVQTVPGGVYDWSGYDALIRECQENGIRPILNVAPYTRQSRKGKPDDMKGYCRFLNALVERYDMDGANDMPGLGFPVTHYEILNETVAVGHRFQGDAKDYFDLLKASYKTIKKAFPEAQVLIAGLADVDEGVVQGMAGRRGIEPSPLLLKYGKNFHSYYDILRDLGAERYYDILSVHIYKGPFDDMLSYYKKTKKPIWLTETALVKEDEDEQCKAIIRRSVRAMAQGVEKIFWFDLSEWQGSMKSSLFDQQMRPTRLLAVFRLLTDTMADAIPARVSRMDVGSKDVACYRVERKRGTPLWVAWSNSGKKRNIVLPIKDSTGSLVATTVLPVSVNRDGGISTFSLGRRVTFNKGKAVKVEVSDSPVLIESAPQGRPDPTTSYRVNFNASWVLSTGSSSASQSSGRGRNQGHGQRPMPPESVQNGSRSGMRPPAQAEGQRLTGRLVKVSRGAVTMKTKEGNTVEFRVARMTQLLRADNQTARPAEFRPGDRIEVSLAQESPGMQMPMAFSVRKLDGNR